VYWKERRGTRDLQQYFLVEGAKYGCEMGNWKWEGWLTIFGGQLAAKKVVHLEEGKPIFHHFCDMKKSIGHVSLEWPSICLSFAPFDLLSPI
jgi:hypothetical protein